MRTLLRDVRFVTFEGTVLEGQVNQFCHLKDVGDCEYLGAEYAFAVPDEGRTVPNQHAVLLVFKDRSD